MNECMHSLRYKYAWWRMQCETLNTRYFQQRSTSINSKKGYKRPILWINIWLGQMIPSLIQKKPYRSSWLIVMPVFLFFTSIVWSSHASSLLEVHTRFRVWPLCSSLSEVIHPFCLLSIRSRFWTKSWSIFFSSSLFGLHDRSFDPSVVDEEPASLFRTLAMGTFSFGIAAFPKFASFEISFSCLIISTFVLDRPLTSTGLSKPWKFSFPSLIRSWTFCLSEV